jgi:hypothetical protein
MGEHFCERKRLFDRRRRREAINVMIDFVSLELEKSM